MRQHWFTASYCFSNVHNIISKAPASTGASLVYRNMDGFVNITVSTNHENNTEKEGKNVRIKYFNKK